jgi:arginase/N-omega-hydroxy-L-arginine amidinohydrolase
MREAAGTLSRSRIIAMTIPLAPPASHYGAGHPTLVSVLALSGWICDGPAPAGRCGAPLIAGRAAQMLSAPFVVLGEGGPGPRTGWRESLDRATPFLHSATLEVERILKQGRRPAVFANRCGASLSTIAAAMRCRPDAVVVWCDAHGDFNTPLSSPSGSLGGMVLAALCGLWESGLGACLPPDRLVIVGARDLGDPERQAIERCGVRMVAGRGGFVDVEAVVSAVAGRPVWLHVDTDVVDPVHAGSRYRVPGGLHPSALRQLAEAIVAGSELVGLELTEFDGTCEPDEQDEAIADLLSAIEPALAALARH